MALFMSASARNFTVFLSCPGDMMAAKDRLEHAVLEMAPVFRRFGLNVDVWRHDPMALPGIGENAQAVVSEQIPDYDVYVGMLCRRAGTPTARAAGGTLEEFADARIRFEATGRPRILFYFCNKADEPHDEAERRQRQAVVDFRMSFPGLFGTFESIDELGAHFRDHLIDLLLEEMQGRKAPPARPWTRELARIVDSTPSNGEFFDRSSGFAERVLAKLAALFDMSATLTRDETDALLAAAHLRALAARGADTDAACGLLRGVPIVGENLEASAREIAALAAHAPENVGTDSGNGGVRRALLTLLLQLGELLDRDHAGIAPHSRARKLDVAEPVSRWIASRTRYIEARHPGIVTHHVLLAPEESDEAKEALVRAVTLGFEAEWQERRPALAANAVAIARAPVALGASALLSPLPDAVAVSLAQEAAAASSRLPQLLHLSVDAVQLPPQEAILPLPSSAVTNGFDVWWQRDRECSLSVWRRNDKLVLSRTSDEGHARVTSAELQPAGEHHRWALEDAVGGLTVASGDARTLSAAEKARWEAVRLADPSAINSWRHSLGLWNELLADLWPRLRTATASTMEARLAYDVLLQSYDWLLAHAPESPRIDAIRDAVSALHATYLTDGGLMQ